MKDPQKDFLFASSECCFAFPWFCYNEKQAKQKFIRPFAVYLFQQIIQIQKCRKQDSHNKNSAHTNDLLQTIQFVTQVSP